MDNLAQALVQFMLAADRSGAQTVIDRAFEANRTKQEILVDILDKAMHQMGEGWLREEYSLAQTFVAAKIAEDTLMRCMPEKSAGNSGVSKGKIVIGNIEDDFHSLGRKILASFLRATDWEVIDLGNDVLAQDFVDEALKHEACLIGVSAMMRSTALNIRKLREEIDRRGLQNKVRLAVGGAVFNWQPELLKEVGGDGTAQSAFNADELFSRLKKEVENFV